MKLSILFISFFIFFGCTKKEYNEAICNELSMNSFKGSPTAANEFSRHCKNIPIRYTHELCQNALNDLIISGSLGQVTKRYGDQVRGCFSENDINRFAD